MRLVMGLGTRAVDRMAGDYPRLVNLSHPQLRPEVMPKAIRYYSQHFVDALDLEQNTLTTVPVESVLGSDYYPLRWLVSVDDGETVHPPLYMGRSIDPKQLILTFDSLLRRGEFVPLMKTVLTRLAGQYEQPVDIEFAVSLTPQGGSVDNPTLTFHLLQCRPQNQWSAESHEVQSVPADLPAEDKILLSTQMVPQGYVGQIEYIVHVDFGGLLSIGYAQRLFRSGALYRRAKQLVGRTDVYPNWAWALGIVGCHARCSCHLCRYFQYAAPGRSGQ